MRCETATPLKSRRFPAAILVASTLALSGCALFGGGTDSCDSGRVDGYVGQPVDSLPELSGVTRIIPPDTMVTQDYWPTRLNIETDEAGTITRVWCG